MTAKDVNIEEQLSKLLDFNAPAVTIEEVRQKTPSMTDAASRKGGGRAVRLKPALAWMLALLVLGALGIGVGVGVSGTPVAKPAGVGPNPRPAHTGRLPPPAKLSDHLVLDNKRVIAGQTVHGDLVVYNPDRSFDLTKGCQPQLAVALSRGSFHQQIAFAAVCDGSPLLIEHGTTRLPVSVDTTYGQCSQSGPGTPSLPRCLKDAGSSSIPPLPAGTYVAKVVWSGPVPLPTPNAASLTLVAP